MTFDSEIFWQALVSEEYLRGAALAILLALAAQVLSCVVGFFLALGRMSQHKSLNGLSYVYVWFFRAVPALMVLLVCWNVLPVVWDTFREDWYTPFFAALLGFTLVQSAYMAEIMRSALLSIDSGQRLAARALGMKPWQVTRLVLLPQMIRVALPPSGNEFISMVKYTSLASVISLMELLATANTKVASSFRYLEYYGAVIVYYLVIVTILMVIQSRIERRYAWISTRSKKRTAAARDSSELVPSGHG